MKRLKDEETERRRDGERRALTARQFLVLIINFNSLLL